VTTSKSRLRAILWVAVAAWAFVIFAFSAVPGSSVPGRYGNLAHFTEYAILGVLLCAALRTDRADGPSALTAVVLASLYAITDEFHQSFVPMRVPDVADWALDTAGALVGAYAVIVLVKIRSRVAGR